MSGVPDRRKAFVMGIVGGIVGAYVMRYYTRKVIPVIFPRALRPADDNLQPDLLEQYALIPRQYEDGETPFQAAGRIAYKSLTGVEPRSQETRTLLGDLVEWSYLITAGAAYGATRTTTRWRDLSGTLFMGLRMWGGDEIAAPLLGLRVGYTRFTPEQHAVLLSAYWVFTAVMTNLTRILYRLFP